MYKRNIFLFLRRFFNNIMFFFNVLIGSWWSVAFGRGWFFFIAQPLESLWRPLDMRDSSLSASFPTTGMRCSWRTHRKLFKMVQNIIIAHMVAEKLSLHCEKKCQNLGFPSSDWPTSIFLLWAEVEGIVWANGSNFASFWSWWCCWLFAPVYIHHTRPSRMARGLHKLSKVPC